MLQQNTSADLFNGRSIHRCALDATESASNKVQLIRGRSAILRDQPRLASLALNSAQAGEADSLEFFLTIPHALRKNPHLVSVANSPGDLRAAVMLHEYRTPLGGARIALTPDLSGRRDVLAPPGERARAAASAARAMIDHGAHFVLIAFSETHHSQDERRDANGCLPDGVPTESFGSAEQAISREFRGTPGHPIRCEWALSEHDFPAYLPLLPTFDATLARVGQRTRSNLRYYRRRAEIDLGANFVRNPRLTLEEFVAFNRRSTYAVPDEIAAIRYKILKDIPNCSMRGVRDAHGQWLSLIGIRHHGSYVEIDWQMNRDDLPSNSLSTVMRSYLIQDEIARGATRLYIEGGTTQPISRSFLKQRASHLTVKRKSAYVGLMERFHPWIFPSHNHVIGRALMNPNAVWKSW